MPIEHRDERLTGAGIEPTRRPESLRLAEWERLFAAFDSALPKPARARLTL